ncbi:MAG: PAS domain-containing protein [Deltaproteobacteria bacterium]|nr:PAS domain-containing protein [Deltaproteobacteria bacterium]
MELGAKTEDSELSKNRLSALQKPGEDKFIRIKSEWEKFISGRTDIDADIIPHDILNSWQRCRSAGLNPWTGPTPVLPSTAEIRALLEDNSRLIRAGGPLIHNFNECVDSTRFLVCLFDKDGRILETCVNEHCRKPAQSARLIPGALWTDETVGTNSISIVLAVGKPAQCFGPQHYMRAYHADASSSAPIYNPQGEFIGGISLISSCNCSGAQPLVFATAIARAIETRMKTEKVAEEAHIAGNYQQAVFSAIPQAVIALDLTNRVTMINDSARRMLQIHGPIEGRHIRDVVKPDNGEFFSIIAGSNLANDTEVRIALEQAEAKFVVSSTPICFRDGVPMGKIIILSEPPKIRKPPAKMIGAKANFQLKDICGRNSRFVRTVQHVQIAAGSDSNVLLLGESGTGKDIFAQVIHNSGSRRNGPYVAVNCASIPRDLIASELFGHAEGAFTGSRRGGNTGKFELACGGTIFLDEIAETSLEFQAALLRVVEDKAIVRVGGTDVRPVDIRIIAATNQNIMEKISKGSFRQDLYYRLNVFTIKTLPLRERKDDIPLLIDRFIKKCAGAMGKKGIRIEDNVVKILEDYPWPGNIRELQNIIERMITVASGQNLTIGLVPEEILHWRYKDEYSSDAQSVKKREKETIIRLMRMDIPRNKIAEKLNMARSSLYRKLKEYGLDGEYRGKPKTL